MDKQRKRVQRSYSFSPRSSFKEVPRGVFNRRTVHRYPSWKSPRNSVVRKTNSTSCASSNTVLETTDPLSLVKLSPILTGSFYHVPLRPRSRSRSRSRSSSVFSGSLSSPFPPISPGPTSPGPDDVFYEEIPFKGKSAGMLYIYFPLLLFNLLVSCTVTILPI